MTEKHLHTDRELVKELKKGNITAFNQLFYSYSSKLYRFANGYFKSKEDAEELVQEVFTKIWEKRKDLDEESKFKSYLFTIAFNDIKKHYRSKSLLNKYFDYQQTKENLISGSQEVDYQSLKSLVDQLVEKMPEKRKAVFIKSRYEGKNANEISEEMSISKSTVENHLNQALKFLRKHLNRENFAGLLFFLLFIQ